MQGHLQFPGNPLNKIWQPAGCESKESGIMGRLDVKSGNFYEWLLHIGRANNRVNSAALKYEADPSYIGLALT